MKRLVLGVAALFVVRSAAADGSVPVSFTVFQSVDAVDTFQVFGPRLGLGPNDTMQLIDVVQLAPDRDGYRFQQYHQGLKVIGAKVGVHARGGKATAVVGMIAPSLNLRLTTPRPERDARAVAQRATQARSFAPSQPPGELVITYLPSDRTGIDPRVAWRFAITATSPFKQFVADVDAYDLSVITLWHEERSAFIGTSWTTALAGVLPPTSGTWSETTASGTALYDGTVQFGAQVSTTPNGRSYRLRRGGTAPVFTFDLTLNANLAIAPAEFEVNSTNCSGPFESCNGNNCTGVFEIGNCNNLALAAAVNAHHAGIRTMDFFDTMFGHQGVNNQNAGALLLVNRSDDPGQPPSVMNAYQHGTGVNPGNFTASFVAAGDDGVLSWNHLVSLDVVAHEIVHAVLDVAVGGSGMQPMGEPGAIAEAIPDIFAMVIENHVYGTFDWSIGERVLNNACLRDLENPTGVTPNGSCNRSPLPDRFGGTHWINTMQPCNGTNDQCGTHTNAAIGGRWFYLLVNGCSGPQCQSHPAMPQPYEVEAIDWMNAIHILRNTLPMLSPGATFQSWRDATLVEAYELFGPNSPEHRSVANAWNAVGVGPRYEDPPSDPADGETGVDPWKAELVFELGPGYGAAHPCPGNLAVLINTTPTEVDARPPEQLDLFLDNNVLKGRATAALKPNTTYHWLIIDPGITTCAPQFERAWRSFTTGAKRSLPISPTRRSPCKAYDKRYNNGECHPWQLEFRWQDTPGAVGYEADVSEDPSFMPLVEHWEIDGTIHKANVLVEQQQFWRVRPIGPLTIFGDNDNAGQYAVDHFTTTLPTTDHFSPIESVPHPWPVHHEWAPVVGVGYFEFRLRALNHSGIGEFIEPYLHEPAIDRYLVGTDGPVVDYEWDVYVLGPELPYLGNLREEGQHMLGRTYSIDGNAVKPEITTPAFGPNQACIDYQDALDVWWTTIEGAAYYRLSLAERLCHANGSCEDGPVIFDEPIPQQQGVPEQHLSFPDARSMLGDAGFGWRIDVRPFAPGDVPGVSTFSVANLRPPVPLLHQPNNNALRMVEVNDPFVLITWAGDWAHYENSYEVRVFWDPNCVIGPNAAYPAQGNMSAIGFSGLTAGDEVELGWRIAARTVSGSGCGSVQSQCRRLRVKAYEHQEEPPPADSIPCGPGMTYGQGDTLDDGFQVAIGSDPGWVWIGIDTLSIPDRLTFTYGDQLLYDATCTGAQVGGYFWLDGTDNVVNVVADANCDPGNYGNTKWGFKVSCPNEGGDYPVVGTGVE